MKTGRNAIFGIGKATEMIGSKNQRVARLRAIRMPSTTPATPAMAKPNMTAIEGLAEIDREVARQRVLPDPLDHHRKGRQQKAADRAAAGEGLPGGEQQDQASARCGCRGRGRTSLARQAAVAPLDRRAARSSDLAHSRHRSTRFISIR